MKDKSVSVIMGVYNCEGKIKELEKAIKSILNQTLKDFEFIICDDGSTDNTFNIIKKFSQKDNRIKVIRNTENRGLAYSLNQCLKITNGKYIARMDADDTCDINRLKIQEDFLNNNDEFDVVATNANLYDNNKMWGIKKYPEIIKKEDFLWNNPIIHPTVMMRKTALDTVNGYRVKWYTKRTEDYDLWMRMYANDIKFYTIQQELYNFQENKESFARRKYKYRIGEFVVRVKGFRQLKLYPKGYLYIIKPLIVGLIPFYIMKQIKYNMCYKK